MPRYCYWQAKSWEDCLIIVFNILLTSVIAFLAIHYYRNTRKRLKYQLFSIYLGVALWALTNLIKNVYSVTVYYVYSDRDDFNSYFSQIFTVLDTLPAIILQTLYLTIPLKMWKSVMVLLSKMNIERTLQQDQFLRYFLVYLVVRYVILIFPLIAILLVEENYASDVNFVKIGLQLLDSIISNILIAISLVSFLKKFKKIKIDSQDDRKRLKREYLMLVIFSTLRLLIDVPFLIILPMRKNTACIEDISNHYIYSFGYLLSGTFLMHFMPIIFILYIYRPEKPKADTLSESDQTSIIESQKS